MIELFTPVDLINMIEQKSAGYNVFLAKQIRNKLLTFAKRLKHL